MICGIRYFAVSWLTVVIKSRSMMEQKTIRPAEEIDAEIFAALESEWLAEGVRNPFRFFWRLLRAGAFCVVDVATKQVRPFVPSAHHARAIYILGRHRRLISLKSRQVFMTTLAAIWLLFRAAIERNFSAVVINFNAPKAIDTMQNRFVAIARDSEFFSMLNPEITKQTIRFPRSGGVIDCASTARSGTFSVVLWTEAAITAEWFPPKFRESVDGSAAAAEYGFLWMETTPYGSSNLFADMVKKSIVLEDPPRQLEDIPPDSWVLSPTYWWQKTQNVNDDKRIIPVPEAVKIREKRETAHGVVVSESQFRWWNQRMTQDAQGNTDRAIQEHPWCLADMHGGDPARYVLLQQMNLARADGRIKDLPLSSTLRSWAFWDLGWRDSTAFIVVQDCGDGWFNIPFAVRASGERLSYFLSVLASLKLNLVNNFVPHDSAAKNFVAQKLTDKVDFTVLDAFRKAGVPARPMPSVRSVVNKQSGAFMAMQDVMERVRIDPNRAIDLVSSLDTLRRRHLPNSDAVIAGITAARRSESSGEGVRNFRGRLCEWFLGVVKSLGFGIICGGDRAKYRD